jgi:cobaltochelatase CobS
MGDETGLYNGTQPQNFAQLDRFKIVENVTYPKADVEKKIVKNKTGIDDGDILNKICEFARLIREAFTKEEIRVTMSTRTIVNVASKIVDFGDVEKAYRSGYINKCSGDDKKFAEEIMQRVWAI